jgi:hypothetical protein
MYYDGGFSAGLNILPFNSTQLMTALHIRKNLAALLVNTAAAVENAKLPAKEDIGTKVNEYRLRAAALMMPNDMAFVITPKQSN